MKNKKIVLILTILSIICTVVIFNAFAHSGRTDANGGHKDNQNKSGLGYYHYHCGGYSAHLHPNGVCPYKSGSSSSSTSSKKSNSKTADDIYDEAYAKGYDEGYDDGYDKGDNNGYYEGYQKGYQNGEAKQKRLFTNHLWYIIPIISVIILFLCYMAFFRKRK